MTPSFLSSEISNLDYAIAKTVILPCPYEYTTSYHTGTQYGPSAILEASDQLELYDAELKCELASVGIYTLPAIQFNDTQNTNKNLDCIYNEILKHLKNNKWIITLGGEHAISPAIVQAVYENMGADFGIVHLDAHFDLRSTYEGEDNSHACALYHMRKWSTQTLSLGVRAFSKEEADYALHHNIAYITDHALDSDWIDSSLANLPQKIYLTIDLDFFSPAEFPGVGTPVPGGPNWHEGLKIIRNIFRTKEVIAMDIVELCPEVENKRSPFAAALLAYKCIGYRFFTP